MVCALKLVAHVVVAGTQGGWVAVAGVSVMMVHRFNKHGTYLTRKVIH